MKPTIRDVAKRAGVANSTVSLVINDRGSVSEATRQRVIKAINELNYRPNNVARRLAKRSTSILALVVPDIANPFYISVIHGVENAARKFQFDIMLYNTNDDEKLERQHLDSIWGNRVEAAILIGRPLEYQFSNDKLIVEIVKEGIHVVLVERTNKIMTLPSISVDKKRGMYQTALHLANMGHTRIAFIAGYVNRGWSGERLAGYKQALQDAGLAYDESLVLDSDFTTPGGYQVALNLLKQNKDVTAILCANDLTAIGALKAADELGRKVPEDLSIAGFDNIWVSTYLKPSLTTVSWPIEQMGAKALEFVSQMLSGNKPSPLVWRLTTELIVRNSTGPVR